MFAFVTTNAPFRYLKLVGDSVSGLLSLRRHAHVLASATKVHWDSGGGKLWRPPTSINLWTIAGQSFQFMLSVLHKSTSLHTLQLVGAKLNPSHQLVILSIPTLKTLMLQLSHFVPTDIQMPLSSVASLSFVSSGRRDSLVHTLRLLENSLETLEVGYLDEDIYPILETVQLPRLTSLEHWGFYIETSGLNEFTPRASSTVTRLCITTFSSPRPLRLPDRVFPQLRELFSPWWIAVQIVPGRPVQVFHEIEENEVESNTLQASLALLSQSTRGIEEMRLYTLISMPRLLQLLATHVPQLQRLHLWTRIGSPMTEYLELQQTPMEGGLAALIEIHIGFVDRWAHIRPSIWCMLSAMFLWTCPALEIAKIYVGQKITRSGARWDISSQWELKLRRIPTGIWELLV